MLTQERLRHVVDYNPTTGVFRWRNPTAYRSKPGDVLRRPDDRGYLRGRIDGKDYKLHRLAWFYVYGEWPDGQIDHKNRVKDDNRIINLRVADNSLNGHNKSGPNSNNRSSKTRGVWFVGRDARWVASIKVNGKRHVRYCDTEREAIEARREMEQTLSLRKTP